MTDSSNIDDILKSIDALLKEDEPKEGNDDAPEPVNEPAQADVLPENQAGIQAEIQDVVSDQSIRILPDADEQGEASVSDSESVGENSEQGVVNGPEIVQNVQQDTNTTQGKRLVLSAEMQVEDTPELPIMVDAVQADSVEDGGSARDDGADEALIAHISAEVCAGLNQRLPALIAPLVEAAVRRHLSSSDESNQHAE